MSQNIDLAGNNLIVDSVYVGASTPGSSGTLLAGSELTVLDGVTAGTVTASKAVVVGTNKEVDTLVIADSGLKLGSGAGTAVTATAAELNMAADSSTNTEAVTGANVITAAESGKTFFLNSTTAFASTLPAPAAGLRFTFIVTAVPGASAHTIVTNGGSNVIQGAVATTDGNASVLGSNEDTISLTTSSIIGDRVDVISNGTNWYVSGLVSVAAGITFTVT